MAKTPAQRQRKKRMERERLRRRRREGRASKLDARVTAWFPKAEDRAEQPRPATLDDEVLEMQRELLKVSNDID